MDCNGNNITYGTGSNNYRYGVADTGYNGTTVKDCIISEGNAASWRAGILFNYSSIGANNSDSAYNNTVTKIGPQAGGIELEMSNGTSVYNNTITMYYYLSTGVYMANTRYSVVQGNRINAPPVTYAGFGAEGLICMSDAYTSIYNNSINSSGTGIDIYSENYSTVYNNSLAITNSSAISFFGFNNSVYNNVISSKGDGSGSTGTGITINSGGTGNALTNDTITVTSSAGAHANGLMLSGTGDVITNMSIKSSEVAVYFSSGTGELIANSTITNSSSNITSDYSSTNNMFLNVSYNKSRVVFWNGGNNVTFGWYSRVNVTNYSGGAVSGANVNLTDVYGTYNMTNALTGANGLTSWVPVWEWAGNDTVNYTYNNHTASTENSTFPLPITSSVNVTAETTFNLSMQSVCGNVNQNYTLQNNVSSSGTCFTIGAENVTLDCNGYNVTFGNDANTYRYGVADVDHNGTVIRNCVISEGTANNYCAGVLVNYTSAGANGSVSVYNNSVYKLGGQRGAIELKNANGTLVFNNTVNGYSALSALIYSDGGGDNAYYGNRLYAKTTSVDGIYFSSGAYSSVYNNSISGSDKGITVVNYNSVYNNTVVTPSAAMILSGISCGSGNSIFGNTISLSSTGGSTCTGISAVSNNSLTNDSIVCIGSGAENMGVLASSGGQNNLTNMSISSNGYGIFFSTSSGNMISNSTIVNASSVNIHSEWDSVNNTALNVSFNRSQVDWAPLFTFGTTNNLTIAWYARVNVTDGGASPVPGAYVNLTDVYGVYNLTNAQTGSDGLTSWVPVYDWAGNSTINYSYNNHTVYAANSTFWVPVAASSNITGSATLNLTLQSACGNLTQSYTLANNVSSQGTCFITPTGGVTFGLQWAYGYIRERRKRICVRL